MTHCENEHELLTLNCFYVPSAHSIYCIRVLVIDEPYFCRRNLYKQLRAYAEGGFEGYLPKVSKVYWENERNWFTLNFYLRTFIYMPAALSTHCIGA
jgi:hypothetical protein